MRLVKIGIISTAGRGVNTPKMTKQLFDKMFAKAEHIITKQLEYDWQEVILISGGAAWSGKFLMDIFNSLPRTFLKFGLVLLYRSYSCSFISRKRL